MLKIRQDWCFIKCKNRKSHTVGHTSQIWSSGAGFHGGQMSYVTKKPGHTTFAHPGSWKEKDVCHMMWHTTFYHNTILICTHILWTYVLGKGTCSQDTAPIFTYMKI